MRDTYSALELARAAGYSIRPVPSGAMTVHEGIRLIELGPDATEQELIRVAWRHLDIAAIARPFPLEPAVPA